MPTTMPPLSRAAAAVLTAAIALTGAACSPAQNNGVPSTVKPGQPAAHAHGIVVSQDGGTVLVATHDGLFDYNRNTPERIGAANDLMGFAATAEAGVYYASGHPGTDSPLPNPLGLLRTTDGGKTWEMLSNQRQSDFHALAATRSGIVAFDGDLKTSSDTKTWTVQPTSIKPAVLAGNPGTDTVLATTPGGLYRSADAGRTWAVVTTAPVLQFAAFATGTAAAGITRSGEVHVSNDAGLSWTKTGTVTGQVQAMTATPAGGEYLSVWAATGEGLLVSHTSGADFAPYKRSN
ncbi:F510_1955 family glycosylhydrolase [Pseudarthrobacter sp. N5]|uniref:F510_1955 family glycosylhydrolase n=1 Tax=Pseudarthrobacter sp. N5 TaxID=3418416 RepID=UPI003CF8A39F